MKAINIGTATQGGDASFGTTVAATTVTITGGDGTNENAGAVFVGTATIANLALVGGSNGGNDDATAEFQSGLTTATAITLDDGTASDAIVIFSATTGTQTITATIDGVGGGEGTLSLTNTDGVDIEGNIGAANDLKAIIIAANVTVDVGDSGTVDVDNFDANTITLNAGSTLRLASDVNFVTVVGDIVGGAGTLLDVDADATVAGSIGAGTPLNSIEIADNVTLTIDAIGFARTVDTATLLLENAGAGATLAITDSVGRETVSFTNAITTAATTKGTIAVSGGATADFDGDIGTTGERLAAMTIAVGTSKVTAFGDVFVNTITFADDATSELTLDGTAAQIVSGAITGTNGSDGRLIVVNAAGVTFQGNIGASTLDTIIVGGATNSVATFEGTVAVTSDIFVGQNTTDGTATFKNTVTASTIEFGSGSNPDTNSITFDATGGAFAVTGDISDAASEDNNSILVKGVFTVTFEDDVDVGDGTDNSTDTITIGEDGFNQAVVFEGSVTAGSGLFIGDGTADTNTVTFDTADGDTVIAAPILENDVTDTSVINITGENPPTLPGLQ